MSENYPIIKKIYSRQILDSRGNPTIEVEVDVGHCSGRAAVPSGASTGKFEALELRDNDNKRFHGKEVRKAITNVVDVLQPQLIGKKADQQNIIDQILLETDGTENKSNCGANAILGVSMACAVASSKFYNCPLYHYLNKDSAILPVPMINVLNGGMHADGGSDIQEIMLFPVGASSFSEAIRMGAEIFHELKKELKSNGLATTVGDEGGFAPQLQSNEHAIELLLNAIEKTSYKTGKDVFLALDVAASSLYQDKKYHLALDNQIVDDEGMIKFYEKLINQYPIISIEDGLDENDWKGWTKLNASLGGRIQIVGDDLTVTNPKKLNKAISENTMNSILIKLNQIGTVSETVETINIAKNNNYNFIISHRSGETEDTFIADFSVAMGGGQIKTGSVCRTDRTSKYNQLLRIEEKLSPHHFGKKFSFIK
ncbi:MAG: phosphopyruvate hydratase [Candidatus Neomarinimicrobiota bacterium]|jgi:enolase|uniref:phosphopyruvate hydratase n=1 Tax=marine metagenome TaxID=408172 RepID=A0A381PRX2_9ZZZZ|nr:phosphopyruvate hydratase [Candidatus Neomarinimicrobiota bacterium]|tara:strand:+ start:13499 stop:14779 length:1281 start_codon:yes stop_codon:yes gene_type:complete